MSEVRDTNKNFVLALFTSLPTSKGRMFWFLDINFLYKLCAQSLKPYGYYFFIIILFAIYIIYTPFKRLPPNFTSVIGLSLSGGRHHSDTHHSDKFDCRPILQEPGAAAPRSTCGTGKDFARL